MTLEQRVTLMLGEGSVGLPPEPLELWFGWCCDGLNMQTQDWPAC
jgi:hypothetical protein